MPREGINWAASNWPAILALLWCLLLLNVPLKLKHVTNIQNLPLMSFCQTSSVFSDPLDLLDHPLLLDIFFLGAPQLRAGVGFLFFYKVSFEKHPSVQGFSKRGRILQAYKKSCTFKAEHRVHGEEKTVCLSHDLLLLLQLLPPNHLQLFPLLFFIFTLLLLPL